MKKSRNVFYNIFYEIGLPILVFLMIDDLKNELATAFYLFFSRKSDVKRDTAKLSNSSFFISSK